MPFYCLLPTRKVKKKKHAVTVLLLSPKINRSYYIIRLLIYGEKKIQSESLKLHHKSYKMKTQYDYINIICNYYL